MRKGLSLGIDVGGTKIAAVVYDYATKTVLRRTDMQYKKKPPSMKEFARVLWSVTDEVMKDLPRSSFKGIGIGSGGVIAPDRIYASGLLGVLNRFQLRQEVEKRFHLPTKIVGDVQAGIVAEWVLGKFSHTKSFLMIMTSTGCNAAFIKDGKVQSGAFDGGWSAWKMTFDIEKVKRGERGDLESMASEAFFRRKTGRSPLEVADLARAGDPDAVLLWYEYGQNLGIIIASLVNLLGPEAVVIGGGLTKSWNLYASSMREAFKKNVFSPITKKKTKISRANFGANAGVIGAALLPHLQS